MILQEFCELNNMCNWLSEFVRNNEFFTTGFWAMALIMAFAPLSLFGHLIITIWITVKKYSFTTKTILISSIVFVLGLFSLLTILLLNGGYDTGDLNIITYGLTLLFWVFYFIFIPQLLTNWLINTFGQKLQGINFNTLLFVLRLIILIAITILMIYLHSYIGAILGVTPD